MIGRIFNTSRTSSPFSIRINGNITYHFGHPKSNDQLFVAGIPDFQLGSLSASLCLYLLNFKQSKKAWATFLSSILRLLTHLWVILKIQVIEKYPFQKSFRTDKTNKNRALFYLPGREIYVGKIMNFVV